MNEIMVNGTMSFMGMEIPVVNGGFGENQLAVSDLTVSQLHDYEAREVRRKTKDNIERFEFGVDVIDLKGVENFHTLGVQLGYNKSTLTQADNIFIYSKRGYFKLVKLLNDDKSWDVYNDLVDDYFNMKLELQQNKPSYMIADEIERARAWIKEQEEKRLLEQQTKELQEENTYLQLTLDKIVNENTTFDDFQRKCNKCIRAISIKTGSPHYEVWNDVYLFLYDKHGINLRQRAINKREQLNQERFDRTGKHYSDKTLQSKVSYLSTVKAFEYITVLKVIESLALKHDINILELNELN